LSRWKPDLRNYNVTNEQRNAINETAINYFLDQLKILFKNYDEPGYDLKYKYSKSQIKNLIFEKLYDFDCNEVKNILYNFNENILFAMPKKECMPNLSPFDNSET